jgi:membrane protease subunit (stomatin/prohibitin family)
MSHIPFTANHEDLSTDRGFQFKFYCQKCGNGYASTFKTNKLGAAASAARVAGSLLGGIFRRAADSAYEVQRQIGGPAHDAALREATEEIARLFKQCSRCGQWVCEPVCWNKKAQLCESCAPDLDEATAAAQHEAAVQQIREKAQAADWTKGRDIGTMKPGVCPSCGAHTGGATFCPECGTPQQATRKCAACGHEAEGSPKFCPECGQPLT